MIVIRCPACRNNDPSEFGIVIISREFEAIEINEDGTFTYTGDTQLIEGHAILTQSGQRKLYCRACHHEFFTRKLQQDW